MSINELYILWKYVELFLLILFKLDNGFHNENLGHICPWPLSC